MLPSAQVNDIASMYFPPSANFDAVQETSVDNRKLAFKLLQYYFVLGEYKLSDLSGSITMDNHLFPRCRRLRPVRSGGRGGDVYIVTNLNDSGEGSLRYGIENAEGPRTIVFEVSGNIELKDHLRIEKPFLTIAGQTAPGDGITLKDFGLKIMDTHDIIMRFIRIRLGDENKTKPAGYDAIETNDVSNIIFDHISASWGIDGTHDLRGELFTLQWSIYGEALNNSLHEKGTHAMLGSMRDNTDNLTLHHNLMHSSRNRHPSLGGGSKTKAETIIDFRNNVIFNWARRNQPGKLQAECDKQLL